MSTPSNKKNGIKLLLKLIVAGAALYFVFNKISLKEILEVFSTANWFWLVIALILFIGSKIISSFRLNCFFRIHELALTELQNLKLYWLGMFYNLFLPGGIGGDAYKIYLLNKTFQTNSKALFSAVLVDRLSGMSLLLFLAAILMGFVPSSYPLLNYSLYLAPLVIVGFYFFLKLFFKQYLAIFLKVSGYSLFVQLAQLVSVYFILCAFHITENELAYLVLFLISSVVAVIPISVGGIGIRELCFLYGSELFGLDETLAISISFSFYLITMIGSFPGIVYVFKSIFPESEKDQST